MVGLIIRDNHIGHVLLFTVKHHPVGLITTGTEATLIGHKHEMTLSNSKIISWKAVQHAIRASLYPGHLKK